MSAKIFWPKIERVTLAAFNFKNCALFVYVVLRQVGILLENHIDDNYTYINYE